MCDEMLTVLWILTNSYREWVKSLGGTDLHFFSPQRARHQLTLWDHGSVWGPASALHGEPVYSDHLLLLLITPTQRGLARLSWAGWLLTYRDGLPAHRSLSIPVLTCPCKATVLIETNMLPLQLLTGCDDSSVSCLLLGSIMLDNDWVTSRHLNLPFYYIGHFVWHCHWQFCITQYLLLVVFSSEIET